MGTGAYTLHKIASGDIAELQRFYDANPEYYRMVMGEPPGPAAAQETFDRRPPDDYAYAGKATFVLRDANGEVGGIADVILGLFHPDITHLGLFIVATRLHGTGAAQDMYATLEAWMRAGGPRWLRLGVVEGNTRAERFWERQGYVTVRRMEGAAMGKFVHAIRVMVKPLAGGSVADYLSLAARDRAETTGAS